MAEPRIELYPRTPWALALFDRLPGNALTVGLALAAALFGAFLAYTSLWGGGLGRLPDLAGRSNWIAEIIQDVFFGATLAIAAASVRAARRDLEALRPALAGEPDPALLQREILTYHPLALHALALASGLLTGIPTPLDSALWADPGFPGWAHPTTLWLAGRSFLNGWAVGFAMALELMLGWRFSGLGARLREPDLTDLRPLAPFGRRAQRNVSWWMLLAAFLSLHYAGRGWAGNLLPLAMVQLAAFACAAFVLPQLGARRRIRARKAHEREQALGALRTARARALAAGDGGEPGRLADAAAWEARVASVRDWPIEAPTLLRLALFVAIGLGSWVGAALVEKLLGRVLG